MRTPATFSHRIVFGAVAVGVLGAVAASTSTPITTPVVHAAPSQCTASGLANIASGVLGKASGYLDGHPGANDVLTAAASQSPEEARSSVRAYFIGHPNEALELRNIAQPLSDLRDQCGVSLTPSQIATVIETLQS
jgi:hemophore-related protein